MSSAEPVRPSQSPRSLVIGTIVAAVTAGVLAWIVGESSLLWVEAKKVPMVTMGQHHESPTAATRNAAAIATAGRLHAAFGAILGLALGVSAGTGLRRAQAGAIGAVLGAASGYAASLVDIPLFLRHRDTFSSEIIPSMLLHCGIWGSIGAASSVGWWFGASGGKWTIVRVVAGGLIGAVLGAVVFDMLGAAFFVGDETGDALSTPDTTATPRLLARSLVSTLTGVGIVVAWSAGPRTTRL
jgi:hypothetical protein